MKKLELGLKKLCNSNKVPTLHISCKKEFIKNALLDSDYMINTKGNAGALYYKL